MFKINWEKGDFAIRTIDNNGKPYVELVKYENDHTGRRFCYTLAFFRTDYEGARLIFVGERPFEEIAQLDISEIWHELWLTNLMLTKQAQDGECDED